MAKGPSSPSIFRDQPPTISLPAFDYSAGYVDSIKDINAPENSLTGGQNIEIDLSGKPAKRGGTTLYNQFMGASSGVTGLFDVVDVSGAHERLMSYGTNLYRDVNGTWTPVTGVTFTNGLPTTGAYFNITNKYYIQNGTDNVVKYQTGNSSADQTDSTFKAGKYITVFQETFLVAGVSGQGAYLWWSNTGSETFGANNYAILPEVINGVFTYYDKVLIFTKRTVQVITNFVYNSTYSAPQNITQLPTNFGAIYEKTIALANGFVYFVGQDSRKKVEIYKTDGMQVTAVGEPLVRNWLNSLSTTQLASACATFDGVYYRIAVADNGQTTNTTGIVFDTVRGIFFLPERKFVENISDYSCFMVSETNGQFKTYAGTSNLGQVYLLNQTNSYDELPEERYLALGTYKVPINANPAKRAAQSFQMHNYTSSQTINITQVALYLALNTGTGTALQVTIQTDNNGSPSGTVVANGTCTLPINLNTAFTWQQALFAHPVSLQGSTTYWIVVQHVTEGSGNSQYYWLGNPCTATYLYGNLSAYSTSTHTITNTFNPGSTAIDGYTSEYSPLSTFAALRGAAGNGSDVTNIYSFLQLVADRNSNTWNYLTRAMMLFDTSAIPVGATITSATLQVYVTYNNNIFSQSVGLTGATPASNTTLANSDYANVGSTRLATDISAGSLSTGVYNTFTLNTAGKAAVSVGGVTKLALRLSGDIDNSAPAWVKNANLEIDIETSRNANPPILTVTYTTTSSAQWVADKITSQNFVVYSESYIDASFLTKAFSPTKVLNPLQQLGDLPSTLSQRVLLQKFYALFSTTGNYNVQIGFTNGDFDSYQYFLFNLGGSNEDNTWGGGAVWGGGGVWGGSGARIGAWNKVTGFTGRLIKVKVRNIGANQPFTFDGLEMVASVKYRQV